MSDEPVKMVEVTPSPANGDGFIDTEGMNLAQKVAAAIIEVNGGGAPQGFNDDKGYPYFTAAQVQEVTLRKALARRGVVVIPQVTNHDLDLTTIAGERGDRTRYDSRITMVFTITDGYESYTAQWVGAGSDWTTPDKGLYGAITSGHKYWLLKVFGIAADESDTEHAAGEEGSVTGTRKAARSASSGVPSCPVCHKDMWDNRPKKASGQFSEKWPDFKCKDKACGGVIWSALQLQPGHSLGGDDESQVPDKTAALAKVAELLKVLYGDKSGKMANEFAKWASQDRTGILTELNLGEVQACETELQGRYAKRASTPPKPA